VKEKDYIKSIIRSVINEQFIQEGVYDKNIFKAFFLAGGPGSGKSFVLSQVFGTMTSEGKPIAQTLTGLGLKVFNIDHAFELELKKRNINLKTLAYLAGAEEAKVAQARNVASKSVSAMWNFYKQGRLGMIVDSTSQHANKTIEFKEELEKIGYDIYMIFVSTDKNVALRRNMQRDRVLPFELVSQIWEKSNANKEYLRTIFGENFIEVENNEDKDVSEDIKKRIMQFANAPIENPIALQWIENEKEIKNKLKVNQHEL
jgi:dephospho-CoA kinase